ncbi:acetyl-CoA synthetase-like protein [Cryphonectria parasitica EP155]|uniref:Acetyl-CoA synthetase-like protein n=1 Tax=Cryphonectria parasitica (strain ATCC 38755 / EP155) TaxID=660469 RepID=A0A9P5CTR5_CRYP1|nr:acetyl-CoA synthetase-like protein [Cryphonectria parasitica EP155]KAF3769701.1 acetyl-CoA synthetase-like protein [Cryphonectria parasitica EP155]
MARPDTVLQADAADPTRCFTLSQTRQLTRQLAWELRHTYGVGRTGSSVDDVLVMTAGDYRLHTLFFGTVAAGGIYSAASPSSTASELAYLIQLVSPKIIICDASTRAVVEETVKNVRFPADHVLLLGDGQGLHLTVAGTGRVLELSPSRSMDWVRLTDIKQLEDTTICILFSSGTTGLPKGVMISHRMIVAECFLTMEPDRQYWAREKPEFQYRTLAHVPAAHVAGVQSYFVNAIYRGGTTYWMPKFDFPKFLEYQKKYKITVFFTVPPIWLAIAKHPGVKDALDTCEYASAGAAPMGAELQLDAEAKLGKGRARLTQVWGLTETCGAITAMTPGEREHTGSVSPLIANHEARIVDDNGKDVEPGGTGEVWVRGPVVTKGYWKNEKANVESFVDGWFCTGDIGRFKDGMLYIVDRKKELIKYKGLQVAPAELEELLLQNPKIADAAVIGVEGEGTEVPRAYVVPATKDLTREDVAKWVDQRAASYKKLRGGVLFIDAIPKSPSGKILRKVLREQAKKVDKASKL